jgi:hypothetical protein
LKSKYAEKSTDFHYIDPENLSGSQGYLSFLKTGDLVEKVHFQNMMVEDIVETIVSDLGEFAFT